MALPSSPPLLPEVDLPLAPPSPPDDSDLPSRPSFLPAKRQLSQLSDYGSLSSDPVFSEATSEAEDDEGEDRPRRKRLVRGPWWDLRRASSHDFRRSMAKRERLRNADSGVYLGSDMSDESLDSLLSSQERMQRLQVGEPSSTRPSQSTPRAIPTAENIAARAINECLDTGHESVDLSNLGLVGLSDATLQPLHQLIRRAHIDLTEPPSEDEFSPLTPSVQLFLSGNRFTSLPSELFKLINITVLSLRNNKLSEIPPSIGKLRNLQELNVAQNKIRWLPWEMFGLLHCRGSHKQITLRPNPLLSPLDELSGPSPLPKPNCTPREYVDHLSRWGETTGAFFHQMRKWYGEGEEWSMRHEMELRLKLGRVRLNMYQEAMSRAGNELHLCPEQLVYFASSAVRYFNVDGSPYRTPNTPHTRESETYNAVVDPLLHAPTPSPTHTPSLFELALKFLQQNYNLASLKDHELSEVSDGLPQTILHALQLALQPPSTCSTCTKQFIIARAEWMEYWFNGFPAQEHLTRETTLPFLRRVCSWGCAVPHETGAFRVLDGGNGNGGSV